MHPYLSSVAQKIARAEEHAKALTDSITAWLGRAPLKARPEYIADRTGYRLVLEPFSAPPPRSQWGLLIGDCVHNLRSALDNLCFASARLKRDPPEHPHLIQFPVAGTQAGYREGRVGKTLSQLPTEVAERIELWQPYRRGAEAMNRDALCLLHHLSIQDKHRVPQVVLLAVNMGPHQVSLRFGSPEDAAAFVNPPPRVDIFGGPVEPGTVLVQVAGSRRIVSLGGTVNVEAVPAIQTLVALEGAMPTIAALCAHVREMFDDFERRFFPDGGPSHVSG